MGTDIPVSKLKEALAKADVEAKESATRAAALRKKLKWIKSNEKGIALEVLNRFIEAHPELNAEVEAHREAVIDARYEAKTSTGSDDEKPSGSATATDVDSSPDNHEIPIAESHEIENENPGEEPTREDDDRDTSTLTSQDQEDRTDHGAVFAEDSRRNPYSAS